MGVIQIIEPDIVGQGGFHLPVFSRYQLELMAIGWVIVLASNEVYPRFLTVFVSSHR